MTKGILNVLTSNKKVIVKSLIATGVIAGVGIIARTFAGRNDEEITYGVEETDVTEMESIINE